MFTIIYIHVFDWYWYNVAAKLITNYINMQFNHSNYTKVNKIAKNN
jgi:hypothetical protein